MCIITAEVSNEIAMATIVTEGTQIEVVDHSFKNSHENQAQALIIQPVTKNTPLLDVKEDKRLYIAHFKSKSQNLWF